MNKLEMLTSLDIIKAKMLENATEWNQEAAVLDNIMEEILNGKFANPTETSCSDAGESSDEYMEIEYSYKDEFGQTAHLKKTFLNESFEDGMDIYLLLDEFKCFLMGAGFSPQSVEKIEMKE